jgi:hypothetical protein
MVKSACVLSAPPSNLPGFPWLLQIPCVVADFMWRCIGLVVCTLSQSDPGLEPADCGQATRQAAVAAGAFFLLAFCKHNRLCVLGGATTTIVSSIATPSILFRVACLWAWCSPGRRGSSWRWGWGWDCRCAWGGPCSRRVLRRQRWHGHGRCHGRPHALHAYELQYVQNMGLGPWRLVWVCGWGCARV